MSEKILVLSSGLFPDVATMEAALGELASGNQISRLDLSAEKMDDAAWDAVVSAITSADRVVTL